MFVCEACFEASKPGERRRPWVVEKRERAYELLDKEGKRIGVVSGWEIKREVGLCSRCYVEAEKAEEYRRSNVP